MRYKKKKNQGSMGHEQAESKPVQAVSKGAQMLDLH